MRDFTKHPNNRRQTPRFLAGIVGVIALSFVTFSAAHASWNMYGKFNEAAVSDAEAQQNFATLKQQVSQVGASVDALASERGQEAQMRQSYGVALPGEGEIKILREAPSTTPQTVAQPGVLSKIWHALFVW